MAARSSTFYRLEKNIGDGFKSVYEFHTVVNGNMYYQQHEERRDGSTGWIDRHCHRCTKESGNKEYKRLLSIGYTFAGKFEMDILGHKEPLKEAGK